MRCQLPLFMKQGPQISPFHILHGDKSHPVGLPEIEDADDVPVGHFPRENEFLFEAPENFRMAGKVRADQLQGNKTLEFDIPRLVNRPHPALPQQLQDLVAIADDCSRLELPLCSGLRRRALSHCNGPRSGPANPRRGKSLLRQWERSAALLTGDSGRRIIRLAHGALHELGALPPRMT